MSFLLTILLSFFLSELIGYGIHRATHWRALRSVFLYKAHLQHHRLYTPSAFMTDEYLSAGKNSLVWTFAPVFVMIALLLVIVLPRANAVVGVLVLSIVSLLNNYMHDSFHLRGHWLERFGWFHRMRLNHLHHHENTKTVYGIYILFWDGVFGTKR